MWLTNRNFNFAIWSECAPIAASPNTHSSSHFYIEAYIFMQTYKKNNKNIRTHKINAQNYPAGHTHRSIAGTNHIFTKGLPRRKRFPPDSININNNNNRKKVWILYVIHVKWIQWKWEAHFIRCSNTIMHNFIHMQANHLIRKDAKIVHNTNTKRFASISVCCAVGKQCMYERKNQNFLHKLLWLTPVMCGLPKSLLYHVEMSWCDRVKYTHTKS